MFVIFSSSTSDSDGFLDICGVEIPTATLPIHLNICFELNNLCIRVVSNRLCITRNGKKKLSIYFFILEAAGVSKNKSRLECFSTHISVCCSNNRFDCPTIFNMKHHTFGVE